MLNRPLSTWSPESSGDGIDWESHRDPQFRLRMLWLVLFVPVLLIGARVAQLQLGLENEFAKAFSLTTEFIEEIPARDGRIVDSEGTVLADDIQQFDLEVYYPAIPVDFDDRWVALKANQRLSKSELRDKSRVAAEKRKVVQELDEFWSRIAAVTDTDPEVLTNSRKKIQARVERIKESVQRQHRQRALDRTHARKSQSAASVSVWESVWQRICEQAEDRSSDSLGPRYVAEEKHYYPVITNISADLKEEIEAHFQRYPYTQIRIRTKRVYPRGELASHLIGYRKPLTEDQFQQRRQSFPQGDPLDYHVGDSYGLDGLERKYDSVLKGIRGKLRLRKNRREEIIERQIIQEPRHGHDLVLTVNANVQHRAEELLDEALTRTIEGKADLESDRESVHGLTCAQGGCLIALDIHTGGIIAAASAPRFDLNLMVNSDREAWDELLADRRSPLISRLTRFPMPPGSVFKPITAVAAMESGVISPETPFHCQGYLDRPDRHRCLPFRHYQVGHGDITLDNALCRSCNVYFYSAARKMGPDVLVHWAREFGIGRPTGIDLPFESAGHLPSPADNASSRERRWKASDTLDLSIGQSYLEVTPLQIARMMAAIANDGYLVTPRLAKNAGPVVMDGSKNTANLIPVEEAQRIPGLHRHTLESIRNGLHKVVQDPHGTGYRTVRLKEIEVAGKTGTAQTNGIDHAWFAGYVPADQPRFAFAIVVQNGGGGGKVAGPIAHELVKAILELELISKSPKLASDRSSQRR